LIIVVILSSCASTDISDKDRFVWKTMKLESRERSSQKLESLWKTLETQNTDALLVIRNDHIIFERYSKGYHKKKKHYTASLAKSLVGGMSLLVALTDGRIGIDDYACKYIPEWKKDPLKSKITIRQLATHTSGLEDAESAGKSHAQLSGWKGNFWKREPDPFIIARDQVPVIFEPGTDFAYSNPGIAMLGYAVTAALKNAPESNILSLLTKRIMDPIGVALDEWSIGYGEKSYLVDNMQLYATWGGASFTARAVARVGRLMLSNGEWQGNQLVGREWVKAMTAYGLQPEADKNFRDPKTAPGLCWWTNYKSKFFFLPRDAFFGLGSGQQILLVIPSLDLIVVRNGKNLDDLHHELFQSVMEAVI
jgi:CubicO group peptidase (beta-lactamase class C family)